MFLIQKTFLNLFFLTLGMFSFGQTIAKQIFSSNTLPNQTAITNLIVSETFTAGDFPVKILELTGSSPYSGKGFIIVPYLSDTRIAVEFNNITVNTNYQLINGVVQTTYNPSWGYVSDVEDLTGEGEQVEQTVPFVIGGAANITINAAGDIVITGPNNQVVTIPGGKDVVITDSQGNVYNVDSAGNVSGPFAQAAGGAPTPANTDGVNANGQATTFSATGVKVVFKDFAGAKYAFDDISTAANAPDYIKSEYKKVGNDYLIYKAVVNQQTDYLIAKVEVAPNATINLNEIVFKTQRGALVPSERVGTTNEIKLKVTGTQTYADEEVLATIKQGEKYKVAGAFKLVHISAKDLNVVLVPMNNKNIPNTEIGKIKDIYKKAGVNVNVTISTGTNKIIETGGEDHKIEVGNSNILSIYTNEQKEINKKIKLLAGYNQTTYYLLYSDLPPSITGISGFMALSGQFGYVFSSTDNFVAAHELGHGALGLEHPFKTEADQGKTNFLLDYSIKNELWHKDWKQINDPKFRLYNFQGDSEGELGDGYTFGPDFKLISTGMWSVCNIHSAGDGFLGGFYANEGNLRKEYKWTGSRYATTSSAGIESPYTGSNANLTLSDNSIVRVFFDNNKPCGQNKYIRTLYKNVKAFIIAKNITGLLSYVNSKKNIKFTQNPQVYCDTIVCTPALQEQYSASQTSSTGLQTDITINNAGGLPQDYIDLIIEKYKNTGVPTQINIYKEGETVPTTKATNGITLNVKVKLRLNPTVWEIIGIDPIFGFESTSTVPNNIIICLNEKYAEYLALLKARQAYIGALRPKQIAMEVGLCLYNAMFVVRCYFKSSPSDTNGEAFVRGAVFEALETIDVVMLILGGEEIVTKLAEKCVEKNVNFVKSVYGLTKKVVTGTLAAEDTKKQVKEVLSIFMPPCVDIAMIEKGLILADTLRNKFKENPWYNSGRIATIVVPLIITGGTYAYAKIRSLTSGLTLTTATLLENTISLNEKLIAKGLYLEESAGKTLIKNVNTSEVIVVESTTLVDVEKAVDDFVIVNSTNFVEGLVNGVRSYNIAGEIIEGLIEITRQVTLGNKTITLKWKVIDGTIDFTSEAAKSSMRSQIKNFLGIPAGSGVDAHHVLSLGKCDHPIVQLAAKNGFHPNIPESILGLEHYDDALQVGLHQNHPAYDNFIEFRLNEFKSKGNFTSKNSNEFIQKRLIPELKAEIFNAKNSASQNLNSYFRDIINPRYNIN